MGVQARTSSITNRDSDSRATLRYAGFTAPILHAHPRTPVISIGCGYFKTTANTRGMSEFGRIDPLLGGAERRDMRISPVFDQSRSADWARLTCWRRAVCD